jgi:hypothetical protein
MIGSNLVTVNSKFYSHILTSFSLISVNLTDSFAVNLISFAGMTSTTLGLRCIVKPTDKPIVREMITKITTEVIILHFLLKLHFFPSTVSSFKNSLGGEIAFA